MSINAVDFRRKQNINPIINKPMMATSLNNKVSKPISELRATPRQQQNKVVTLDDVLYGDFSNKKKNNVTLKFDNINDVLKNINSDDDDIDKKTKKKNNKILTTFLKQEATKINFSDY
jgi:hypothetical protein